MFAYSVVNVKVLTMWYHKLERLKFRNLDCPATEICSFSGPEQEGTSTPFHTKMETSSY
jgi:ABC-type phosphate transport system ATPase subunit